MYEEDKISCKLIFNIVFLQQTDVFLYEWGSRSKLLQP